MKHVIIGGVAGGATAAARIRRADEFAEIILLERGKYISYANCGLPYYIGGVIEERENLFLQTPQSFGERFNVDVRVQNEAIAIDTEKKTLTVKDAKGEEYTETYDKLLLSPGAKPVVPRIEGADTEGVFVLRDVLDTDRIKNFINRKKIQRAVVVGAGFIGLEMAENLQHAGAAVSIVEMGNQVMAPVDYSMASLVHQHLMQKGVDLYLEQAVERISSKHEVLTVHLSSGKTIESDVVIMSIGVRPETGLAVAAGLKIGETGGIWVDQHLETSAKDVYAVGDAIEYPHPLTGKPWLNYLANPANRQGRIVADNMVFGYMHSYEGAIGTCIAKVYDMTVAATGLSSKKLSQLKMPFRSSWTHSSSHAGYYPGALPISLKITFEPETGKLYGAQAVGYEGVDKRIDQLALLIKQGGSVYDLLQIEHAYAPPFSSAKDPISIAGYVASNIINQSMPIVTWKEMKAVDRNEVVLLDVRTRDEFSMGSIPGAINIPLDELRTRLDELPTSKPIYIFCAIGLRGYLALTILKARGFEAVKNLSGGYKTYSTAVAPIQHITPKLVFEHHSDIVMEHQTVKYEIKTMKIDASGLQCPGPILRIKEAIDSVIQGERVEIVSTDAGFARDIEAWCNTTGNLLISSTEDKGRFTAVVEKGKGREAALAGMAGGRGKTFIMFSDDLDKALATFVLANGAAATGEKVSIFFTFWGLNVIKKTKKPAVKKDFLGKMFSLMLPAHSLQLKLSKMNMLGMGSKMMRYIMKQKGVDSLEAMREQALASGVEFIACQMSMDVMGVNREELVDQLTIGGVATYIDRADKANINLFI